METSIYPNLTSLFKKNVLQKYLDCDGDPDLAIKFVDVFLNGNPFYPEALLFKSRMLIAKGQDKEALVLIEAAKKIDEWKNSILFDQAEVLFKSGNKELSIACIKTATENLLQEILEGFENYLLGIDFDVEQMEKIINIFKKEIAQYILSEGDVLNFSKIDIILNKHQLLS